ncbi:hypothetical protein D3C73_1426090 [compost metagenome]
MGCLEQNSHIRPDQRLTLGGRSKAEVTLQCTSRVVLSVNAPFLQMWYNFLDELVESGRGQMRGEDETVGSIFLHIAVDLARYSFRRADEMLARRDLDHQLADIELFMLGDLAPFAGGI